MLATTLLKNLNNQNFDFSFLKIRLQQLQDSAQTDTSILSMIPVFLYSQDNTYIA